MDYDATFDYDMTTSQDLLTMQFEMDSYMSSMGLNTSGMFGEEDLFNHSFDDPGFGDPFQDFFNFADEGGDSGEGGDTIVVTGERQGWFGRAMDAINGFLDLDGDGDAIEGWGTLGTALGIVIGAIGAVISAPLVIGAGVIFALGGLIFLAYDQYLQPRLPEGFNPFTSSGNS